MLLRKLILSFVLLIFSAQTVFAQAGSNDFLIKIYAGTDATPPTTPTLLTVDPVATTQIDITWSSSTDNFSVSGYSLLRDGTPIATTSLLSYSDTGLTASTTYSYAVRAFDPSYNYSTTSNSLSTTTLSPPPVPPTPTSTPVEPKESTAAKVVIKDFTIQAGISTTSIGVQTAFPARIEVRWGRTASYELGYVVSSVYRRDHSVLLTDLEPGTTYEYEIIGYTPQGFPTRLRTGSFATLSEYQIVTPANVARFRALANGDDVDLSWQLPVGDVAHVRIVRSHYGFPQHPQDGAVVYQGLAEAFTDVGILALYSPVYYTAFVYDQQGNISSGAIALAYAIRPAVSDGEGVTGAAPGEVPVTPGGEFVSFPDHQTEATSSINTDRLTPEMKMPEPSDILVVQGGLQFTLLDPDITLTQDQDFLVSIPKNTIAGHLKSIIVTVVDPTNNKQAYSYLLRINHDQTQYITVVPALGVSGASQLRLAVYDYEAFVVASYQTPVTFVSEQEAADRNGSAFFTGVDGRGFLLLLLAVTIPFILLFLLVALYRRKEGEDNV